MGWPAHPLLVGVGVWQVGIRAQVYDNLRLEEK